MIVKTMKTIFIMAVAAIMATMTLTSCDIEINNVDEGKSEEYQKQIANTRWQLTAVMNQNNEWVQPDFYPDLDIPELSFYNNSYFMKICTSTDRTNFTFINGTYSIDKYFSINMTVDNYQGIAYTLKVTSLNGNLLEGEFADWGRKQQSSVTASDGVATTHNPHRHTIRMKRTEK